MATKKTKIEEEKPAIEPLKATASLDRMIPKFCTGVNFAVTEDKQFIMTLIFQEGDQPVVIDRVSITHEHAKKLSTVLDDLLKKIKDGSITEQPKNK
jgi:Protein of unknown function (DUF3467)